VAVANVGSGSSPKEQPVGAPHRYREFLGRHFQGCGATASTTVAPTNNTYNGPWRFEISPYEQNDGPTLAPWHRARRQLAITPCSVSAPDGGCHGTSSVNRSIKRCRENRMPLAPWAVYQGGRELWLAPTADDSDGWIASVRHIAIELGARRSRRSGAAAWVVVAPTGDLIRQ
jgi:hypothetical protein